MNDLVWTLLWHRLVLNIWKHLPRSVKLLSNLGPHCWLLNEFAELYEEICSSVRTLFFGFFFSSILFPLDSAMQILSILADRLLHSVALKHLCGLLFILLCRVNACPSGLWEGLRSAADRCLPGVGTAPCGSVKQLPAPGGWAIFKPGWCQTSSPVQTLKRRAGI